MSNILIAAVHGINESLIQDFENGLISLSHKMGIGIFVNDRYVEAFESIYINSSNVYRFSIADNEHYDNCERLLLPYLFVDCSEEIFANNIKKIENVVDYCLKHSAKIELYVGTSGDQYEDFERFYVSISGIKNVIKEKMYEYAMRGVDPALHFIFERNNGDSE